MKNYFNYFTETEDYFVQKRGRNLLVSPLDWSLIELWKDHGVPLHIVFRGIDRSFESASKRQRNPPRTLFYCHPAVMEAFEEYSEAALGESEEVAQQDPVKDVDRASLIELLESLLAVMRDHEQEVVRESTLLVRELLAEVSTQPQLSPSQVDSDLGSLARRLVAKLESGLSAEQRKEIAGSVREALKPYRRRLSDEMLAKLEQTHRQRLIREHFGLPEMTLL